LQNLLETKHSPYQIGEPLLGQYVFVYSPFLLCLR